MVGGLVGLLITVLVVAIIVAVVLWAIEQIPLQPPFVQIIRVLVIAIAAIVIIMRALPLLGVSSY